MGKNLNPVAQNLLTWAITFAVALLIGVQAYTIREMAELQKRLPHEYVQLERYTCDQQRIEATLSKMDNKMDTLLMREKN